MILFFNALWPFDVAKGGEKNGYFRNKDIIFTKFSFKIKHEFKKKGGERDE